MNFYKLNEKKCFISYLIGRGVCVGLLSLIFLLWGCGKEKQEKKEVVRPVKIMTLKERTKKTRLSYPAKVEAIRHADLAFEVDGPIMKFNVKPGDAVKKGEVLAYIDPTDYKTKVKVFEAKFDAAKADYLRYKKLVDKGAVSRADFEKRKRNYEVAKSELQLAKKALRDTQLRAPFDGVIAARFVEEKQNVHAKQKVLRLQDVSQLEVIVDIPEQDVAMASLPKDKTKIEQILKPMAIFPVAPDKKFDLALKEAQTAADPVTQTFKVTFKMSAPKELNIKPGMTAEVEINNVANMNINGKKPKKGFDIPITALYIDKAGRKCIWIVDSNMKVHCKKVETGSMHENKVTIYGGVKSGDRVVIFGVNSLWENMKIRPLNGR